MKKNKQLHGENNLTRHSRRARLWVQEIILMRGHNKFILE